MFTSWIAFVPNMKQICPGIILWTRPANKSRRYIVTLSLIGWGHSQNDPCLSIKLLATAKKAILHRPNFDMPPLGHVNNIYGYWIKGWHAVNIFQYFILTEKIRNLNKISLKYVSKAPIHETINSGALILYKIINIYSPPGIILWMGLAPGLSQWEMTLHCDVISHWLSLFTEYSLPSKDGLVQKDITASEKNIPR